MIFVCSIHIIVQPFCFTTKLVIVIVIVIIVIIIIIIIDKKPAQGQIISGVGQNIDGPPIT